LVFFIAAETSQSLYSMEAQTLYVHFLQGKRLKTPCFMSSWNSL